MRTHLKKTLVLLSVIPLLTGCKVNTFELNHFFDDDILRNRDMVGLPRTPGNLLYYRNIFGHVVYSNGETADSYNAYTTEVFNYLKGREYKYLGRVTRAGQLFDRLTDYYYHPATELSEFYYSSANTYYFFFTNKDPEEVEGSNEKRFPSSFVLEVGLKDSTVKYSENPNASEEEMQEFQSNFEVRIHGTYTVFLKDY